MESDSLNFAVSTPTDIELYGPSTLEPIETLDWTFKFTLSLIFTVSFIPYFFRE